MKSQTNATVAVVKGFDETGGAKASEEHDGIAVERIEPEKSAIIQEGNQKEAVIVCAERNVASLLCLEHFVDCNAKEREWEFNVNE